ncbi:hypothetical protein BH18ACI2_BH18ACI2_05000 [soil metagenome]
MARNQRGCGCLLALLLIATVVGVAIWWKFYRETGPKLPPPSGEELRVHMLDVGQGDSILILTPDGKTALVDAGNPGNGKKIVEAMQRHGVQQIDYLIATHAHADHIGAADEVLRAVPVLHVVASEISNPTKNYEDFLEETVKLAEQGKTKYEKAAPGQTFDLGGGAIITVLAPIPPFFTKDQLRSGGNEPNANSVVTRLDYGEFSMLLTGDAEAQTEQRLIANGARLEADILKVGHHGSKYATSEEFLQRGQFDAAIISAGADNRYGHPSPEVLARLKAAGVKLYRTDLQGEITITTRGTEENSYQITTEREPTEDLWAGRKAQRDDSSRSGFIQYGDFGPAPKKRDAGNKNANRKNATGGR